VPVSRRVPGGGGGLGPTGPAPGIGAGWEEVSVDGEPLLQQRKLVRGPARAGRTFRPADGLRGPGNGAT
jgi:hypothetical protein